MNALEQEFPLPGEEGSWVVRAYEFPDGDQAHAEWERIQGEWRGKPGEGNFSIWNTALADGSAFFVVICARREYLVEVGGVPYAMTYDEAKQFAIRRAKVGADAFVENGPGHHTQEKHYEREMRIDPATGSVVPYRP